jgi:penicillin-binding protein 2
MLTGFWILLFLVILSRFFYIQVIKGEYFFILSMENMMRLKIIKAPRGLIYDRNGIILARNRPSYAVSVLYNQIKDKDGLVKRLLNIKDRGGTPVFNAKDLKKQIDKARRRRFEPVKLADDVGIDVVTIVEEHIMDLPGILVENESRREYPYGSLACHALGYMGEIPEEQFDSLRERGGYHYGDRIGVFGMEKYYEDVFLHGADGQEYVMVDAFGREIKRLDDMPMTNAKKGYDIYLTLDLEIQKVAESSFPDTQSGAVVVIDPRNGEILAMLSSPRFDPNIFSLSSKKRTGLWGRLILDPTKPLNNRATKGQYPPGSTFKLVTAASALNENFIGIDEKFKSCRGYYRLGKRNFKCWRAKGHGRQGMIKGVKYSCDVYFYQVGLKTGVDIINQYARLFGFGRKTGIDLPQEAAGELLDEEVYNRKFQDRGWIWTQGQVLNASIGQGQVVTPLQLANYTAAMGNAKVLYRPHIFKKAPLKREEKAVFVIDTIGQITLKDETWEMIKKALKAVIEPGGTGGWARVEGVEVGGKTGTAQNPQGEDHALFIAVAPLEAPEIAMAVVVENAGHGGSVAAPIAGKILRSYFKNREKPGS